MTLKQFLNKFLPGNFFPERKIKISLEKDSRGGEWTDYLQNIFIEKYYIVCACSSEKLLEKAKKDLIILLGLRHKEAPKKLIDFFSNKLLLFASLSEREYSKIARNVNGKIMTSVADVENCAMACLFLAAAYRSEEEQTALTVRLLGEKAKQLFEALYASTSEEIYKIISSDINLMVIALREPLFK